MKYHYHIHYHWSALPVPISHVTDVNMQNKKDGSRGSFVEFISRTGGPRVNMMIGGFDPENHPRLSCQTFNFFPCEKRLSFSTVKQNELID